jgi:RNA polymerase sigma factor (sigma-70 family)
MAPYLRALAARCFKAPGDIEDAVQDVLLTVHAVRHTYDPGRPFGPWLVAIANRRIIDRLRRQMRDRSREIELTAEHETFSLHPANLRFDETSAALAGPLVVALRRDVVALIIAHIVTNLYGIVTAACVGGNVIT